MYLWMHPAMPLGVKVSVRESHQEMTIKYNKGEGTVRYFQGGKDLSARQIYPGANMKAVMVFLP